LTVFILSYIILSNAEVSAQAPDSTEDKLKSELPERVLVIIIDTTMIQRNNAMKAEGNGIIGETRQAPLIYVKKQMKELLDDELLYPTSDGKPMGETDKHVKQLARLLDVLEAHFVSEPDVYVSGNNLMYYEQGNPRKRVCPDIYVTIGIPKQERRSYKIWVEGKSPDFILELLSGETRKRDFGFKKRLYQNLFQTKEYFLYDPDTEELYGYRLVENRYRLVRPDAGSKFFSSVLRLLFGVDAQGWLRVYRSDGTLLKTQQELAAENQELTVDVQELAVENQELAVENNELTTEVMELSARNASLEEQLARLQLELARLRREM
jgi:Uma2 family endonuclease